METEPQHTSFHQVMTSFSIRLWPRFPSGYEPRFPSGTWCIGRYRLLEIGAVLRELIIDGHRQWPIQCCYPILSYARNMTEVATRDVCFRRAFFLPRLLFTCGSLLKKADFETKWKFNPPKNPVAEVYHKLFCNSTINTAVTVFQRCWVVSYYCSWDTPSVMSGEYFGQTVLPVPLF